MKSKFTMFDRREKKVFNEKKAMQLLDAMLESSCFWLETNEILKSGIKILSQLPKNSEEEVSDFKLTYICLLIFVGMHHDKELARRNLDITPNNRLLSRSYLDKALENIVGSRQINNLDNANNHERTPLLTKLLNVLKISLSDNLPFDPAIFMNLYPNENFKSLKATGMANAPDYTQLYTEVLEEITLADIQPVYRCI